MSRDFHLPGRSPVYAREGMAATSHPLASLAAIETLRAGGTAADAAITAVALLGVIEPQMTGIGGDCFCLVAKPGLPVWGYNGSGRTGAAMELDALLAQGLKGSIPRFDPRHHGAGRGRCLGSDPENAWPLRTRSRAWRRRSVWRRKAMPFRRASRSTGRSMRNACARTRARRCIICPAVSRRRPAT